MANLEIREANDADKFRVLKFCKNTFSWGDYVEHVWNFWLSEGHLFLGQKPHPVGICHAFYSDDQIWIEGIRIDSSFRRQNIASELVKHAESVGVAKNLSFSYMLIDTENSISISMANSLGYQIFETWNFYSIEPKINPNHHVSFEKPPDLTSRSHYVKSWRWLPFDDVTLNLLYDQNRIVTSSASTENSVAILTDSEHFSKTLIVTLFSGSNESTSGILSFLQDYGLNRSYERVQILTKEKLPDFDSLESRISFHLMKKSLV